MKNQNLYSSISSFLLYFIPLFLHLLIPSSLFAQSPQGIPYQAVMRNADGSVMASSAVNLTLKIHDASASGSIVYQETHALTSNAQGLVSCVVGNGTVVQGNFANINWGSGAKFLQVMMGSTDIGTQQLMSVPYALYAGNTQMSVSTTGDTLTIGGKSVIVPGISAVNLPNLYVGQYYLGGKVGYIYQSGDIGYVPGEIHGLIAAESDLPGDYIWGCSGILVGAFSNSIGSGNSNTSLIVNSGCGVAANACADLTIGQYNDWFLPSHDELMQLYQNRIVIGNFQNTWYWSSTENSYTYASWVNFSNDFSAPSLQNGISYKVRPIRYF
jgi:hypothetical protein